MREFTFNLPQNVKNGSNNCSHFKGPGQEETWKSKWGIMIDCSINFAIFTKTEDHRKLTVMNCTHGEKLSVQAEGAPLDEKKNEPMGGKSAGALAHYVRHSLKQSQHLQCKNSVAKAKQLHIFEKCSNLAYSRQRQNGINTLSLQNCRTVYYYILDLREQYGFICFFIFLFVVFLTVFSGCLLLHKKIKPWIKPWGHWIESIVSFK